jgi:hypothetical protein
VHQIFFDPSNCDRLASVGFPAPGQWDDGFDLTPGINRLTSEQWGLVQSHPSMVDYHAKGGIQELKPLDGGPHGEITSYSLDDALLMVTGEYESATLDRYAEIETRPAILRAIAQQTKLLQKAGLPHEFGPTSVKLSQCTSQVAEIFRQNFAPDINSRAFNRQSDKRVSQSITEQLAAAADRRANPCDAA